MKAPFLLAPLILVSGCTSQIRTEPSPPATDLAPKISYLEEWNWRQEEEIKALKQQIAELRGEYLLQPGDTLAMIAAKFGMTIDAIIALNPDIQPAKLKVGQRVKLKKEPIQPPQTRPGAPLPVVSELKR